MENNEKKRFGRRAFFGEQAIILISIAFILCMFQFDEPMVGLKWFLVYSAFIVGISGLVSGLLTKTDIKEMITKLNPLKE